MKLYLDMCALKRPFDDQSQERIAAETHAVLAILGRIERGVDSLAWSSALSLENDADPEPEPRIEVAKVAPRAASLSTLTRQVESAFESSRWWGLVRWTRRTSRSPRPPAATCCLPATTDSQGVLQERGV